jgi:hypothetical protein
MYDLYNMCNVLVLLDIVDYKSSMFVFDSYLKSPRRLLDLHDLVVKAKR